MRKFPRFILWTLGALAVLIFGFVLWGSTPAKPMLEAQMALESERISIDVSKWITFQPVARTPTTGLIIYPGGRVDYRAYAPQANEIAAQGYLVVIVHMPLNLAVMNPDAAAEVIAAYPEIEHWVVGGHSLGGAMAANFVYTNPGAVEGLVLWAAYPALSNDLSGTDIQVLSISGTLDGLSTPEKIAASIPLLPADTTWVAIEGGNHAQFGWYGPQAGDNPATISRADQQAQIVEATLALLARIKYEIPMSMQDAFAKQKYLNLETFRRSGESMKTPVWFVQEGETIYVRTVANSGKVKRIRNNGGVNIVPCKMDGTVTGTWVPAVAREIQDPEIDRKVDKLLDKKYGLMKKILMRQAAKEGRKDTILEIKLSDKETS
jgi:PPOX class probable F420-dependent enzyme